MKLKDKIANVNANVLFIMLAVSIMLTLPIRTYQTIKLVDPKTGFWSQTDFTVVLLYVILAICAILFFVFSYFSKNLPKPQMPQEKNMALSLFSLIFSATLLVDAVRQIANYSQIYYNYGTTYSSQNQNFSRYLMSSGGIPTILQAIFAILSALYFFILAISYFKGSKLFETLKILALSPVLWAICRIIYRFIQPINFRNISQLFLELFMIVFMMLFFMAFARIASSVNQEKSGWVVYASGITGALFATVCGITLLIITVIGKSELICHSYPLEYCDVGFVFFATALLFEMNKNKNKTETNVDRMPDEIQKAEEGNNEEG